MKSNTNLFLMLTLSVLLFTYSCKKESPKDPVDKPVEEVVDDKKPLKQPRILLTYSELAELLQHYDKTRKPVLMEQMGGKKEDARVQFISIKELKQYIRYIERQARRKDIELTGINFISGAYPKNYEKEPEHRDYQTLIMVPATTIDKEEMVSIDLNKSERGKPVTLRELLYKYYNYKWYYDGAEADGIGTANGIRMKGRKTLVLPQKDGGDEVSSAGNRMRPSPPN
jgi:hypothetical protein